MGRLVSRKGMQTGLWKEVQAMEREAWNLARVGFDWWVGLRESGFNVIGGRSGHRRTWWSDSGV